MRTSSATLSAPPRHFHTWLKMRRRALVNLKQQVQRWVTDLKDVEKLPDDYGTDMAYDVFGRNDVLDRIIRVGTDLLTDIDTLDEDMKYPLTSIENKWQQNVMQGLRHMREYLEDEDRYVSHWRIDDRDYEVFEDIDPERREFAKDYGYEQRELDKLLKATDEIIDALDEWFAQRKHLLSKLQAYDDELEWARKQSWQSTPRATGVQTLYHATAFKTEIVRDGWQAEKPDARVGLGGSTTLEFQRGEPSRSGISFTYDLGIAKEVARSIKEVILIVNGQLKAHEVIRWMRDEGLDLNRAKWNIPSTMKYGDPEYTFELYRYWLTMSEHSRTNPMFFGVTDRIVAAFSGRRVSDVGVLECEVDVDNKWVKYSPGEREFRAPPEAVLSTKVKL